MILWDYISSIVYIGLEICSLVLAVILLFKAQDNRVRIIWGIIAIVISLILFNDNLYWLQHSQEEYYARQYRTLQITRMLKWYMLAHIFSMFMSASLRPGWLNMKRIVLLSTPIMMVATVSLCYIWFNGYLTNIDSPSGILENIDKTDVQVRVGLLVLSVINPTAYFVLPFIRNRRVLRRRVSLGMYIYLPLYVALIVFYVIFTITVNQWVWYAYHIMIALFPIIFSILCLREENPLSLPQAVIKTELQNEINPDIEVGSIQENEPDFTVSPAVHALCVKMNDLMEQYSPYTNPDYTIEDLINSLMTSKRLLTEAIQYAGFTGFREYVNFLRLEYFKKLAAQSPGASVMTLMYKCGYTSRTTFYRQFSERELISPKEYIKQLEQPSVTLNETVLS